MASGAKDTGCRLTGFTTGYDVTVYIVICSVSRNGLPVLC